MSRIDDLIAELCPDGVEYKTISEVATKGTNIRWSKVGENEFQYIDLSSVDRLTHKILDTATITASNAPSRAQQIIQTGDVIFATTRPTQMRWAIIPTEFDRQIASTGYCVLRPNTSIILTNFLAHLLGTDSFQQHIEKNQIMGNYPSIPDNRIRAYRVPVPPLEVQREIVQILDKFTKLEAELEAELEARHKQYEYYRNQLLTFNPAHNLITDLCPYGVEYKTLGDLATLVRGNGMPKTDLTNDGVGAIHYGQIYTHYKTWTTKTLSFVTTATATKLAKADPGDIIITNTSENIDDVGKAVAWLGNKTIVTGGHATIIKHNQDPKYLAYWFASAEFSTQKRKFAIGTKVIEISTKNLAKIRVPVPPLEAQHRIVEILDKFDALVNNLTIGLPAEINARHKQYEYYRDKLLTFRELS